MFWLKCLKKMWSFIDKYLVGEGRHTSVDFSGNCVCSSLILHQILPRCSLFKFSYSVESELISEYHYFKIHCILGDHLPMNGFVTS